MSFINLHQHSEYSNASTVLDSIIPIKHIPKTAFELGWSGVAITDHNIMGGHLKFLRAAMALRADGEKELLSNPTNIEAKRKANFKPVLGVEIYLSQEGQSKATHQKGDRFYHFVLLAKDREGWSQLNMLSQYSWGRMYKNGRVTRMPNYISDLEKVIGQNPGHIIGTSACLGSPLGGLINDFYTSEGEEREALKQTIVGFIERMKSIFGDDFYLELQPNQDQEQIIYNEGLIAFAKYTNTKYLVALDSHYKFKEDRAVHSAYLTSQDGVERETSKFYQYTYMMKEDEIISLLSTHLDKDVIQTAISETMNIYDKIEVYDIISEPIVPRIPFKEKENWEDIIHSYDEYEYFNILSHHNDNTKFLIYQTILGLQDKIDKGWLTLEESLPRLNEELQQVWEVSLKLNKDMSTYFTTFQGIVDIIWEVSVIAPGRGSAGAFLLNYVLNITQINPLLYNFPLKRFLAAEKVSLADIDIDAGSSKKDEIIDRLREWGATFDTDVFSIATYGTEKSKSALLTAARGVGIEPADALYWASLIPSERGFLWTLSETYYGDKENGKAPVKEFVEEMNLNPEIWTIAQEIEGLINKRSSHAAGIIFCNDSKFYENISIMKAPNGAWTSQFDLGDLEFLGPIKYDLLSTKAIDSIQAELLLLAENGYIEWKGNLRDTYNEYLHPSKLDYDNPKYWEKINKKEVLSLFQFLDAQSGIQAIDMIQPTSLLELADINSVLRLMAADGRETPLNVYQKRKNNIKLWYDEMAAIGLNEVEVGILEDHVGSTKGMCITQEQLMALVQDKRISDFTFSEADLVRKIIGKKKMDQIPVIHKKFLDQGIKLGNRAAFMDYIWNELFAVQLGYAFSIIHTISYSIIALQETHLNVHYPPIFWAAARLLVEASSMDSMEDDLEILSLTSDDEDEEEGNGEVTEKKNKGVNYFKISSALGEIRSFGVKILPPDINKSSFSFQPSVEENAIYFGLKGISRVGDNVIKEIIQNRPYKSVKDLIDKVKVDAIQATNLIKAGAFDSLGNREDLLEWYCFYRAKMKNTLNLRNMQMLIEKNYIPKELTFYAQLYKYNKHIKIYLEDDIYIIPHEDAEFLNYFNFSDFIWDSEFATVEASLWKRYYEKSMDVIRDWIKENLHWLLDEVNKEAVDEIKRKYAQGNRAKQEMAALGYYYSFHELEAPEYKDWIDSLGVVDFNSLPEQPIVEAEFKGRKIFKLYRIAGTSIGRDKQKHIVGFETTSGFLKAKFYRAQFLKYDKQITIDGKKEPSWFFRGQKLLLTGYRAGDQFIVKTYKKHKYGNPIYKFDHPGILVGERAEEV